MPASPPATPARPRILLLTPIAPAAGGNGLAMRAWCLGQALGRLGELHTALVPVAGPALESTDARFRCAQLPGPQQAAGSWLRHAAGRHLLSAVQSLPERARLAAPAISDQWPDLRSFDLVFVLRLYMAGLVLPLLECSGQSGPRLVLDADEADHALLEHKARLLANSQQGLEACATTDEAKRMAAFTRAVLPWFDAVTASSELEAGSLKSLDPLLSVGVLPNVYPATQAVHAGRKRSSYAARLLFVGNLHYWPNEDGLRWFLHSVWPLLQKHLPAARLRVVGEGGGALQQAFADTRGVDWLGHLPALEEEYAQANACLIPLRAGGGTRLKVLEAFTYGVPAIGTRIGLAGLNIQHQEHALLADDAAAMCAAVVAVCGNAELSSRLASAALQHVNQHFSQSLLDTRMATLLAPLLSA